MGLAGQHKPRFTRLRLPGGALWRKVCYHSADGLQMVAAPRGEAQLLAGAKVLEDILGVRGTTPIDPRAPK